MNITNNIQRREKLPNPCEYPNCPSGQWAIDVKDDLKVIQGNQEKHYEALTQFGAILAHMEALQKSQDRIDHAQDEIFRKLETKINKDDFFKAILALGVIFGIFEIIVKVAWK